MATTPTTTTTTPPSTPIFHVINFDLNESWCDLNYKSGCSSTGSISHLNHSVNPEVLEKLLQEAQKDVLPSPLTLPNANKIFYPEFFSGTSVNIECSSEQNPNLIKKKTILIDENNKNLVNLNSNNSIIPIISSKINVYDLDNFDDDEEDVDLEYVEDDTCDELNSSSMKINKTSNCHHHHHQQISNCGGAPGPAVSTPCQNCIKHKKQIDLLIEKQINSQKELIKIKNEYECKLLNKSLELSTTSSLNSFESNSNQANKTDKYTSTTPVLKKNLNTDKIKTSGSNTPNLNSNDWIKYFSSRPQAQPPKEWNFVHPNSNKSKLIKMDQDYLNECNKTEQLNYNNWVNSIKNINKENIGKLLFTHMASFIVGATLMFLVLKRHLNLRSSVYFI